MKIESLIIRKGGTFVDMEAPKRQYHFKPSDNDDRHIADVDIEHHARTLLRIKEGYRAIDADDFLESDPIPDRQLNGSTVHNASYVIKGGDTISLADLIDMAFDDSGLTEEEWNALADGDRYDYIDTTLKELVDGEHGDDEETETQTQESTNTPNDTAGDAPSSDSETDGDNDSAEADQSVDATANAVNADQNGNGVDDNLEGMTRKELEPIYKERFGRLPSSGMTVPQIRAALSEDDE